MLKEFFTAALGMQNQLTRLEVTANNMANANTTGYKRAEVFERNLIDARANFNNTKGDVEQNDPPVGSYVVFDGGSTTQTDNPLDVAIQDDGFFLLKDDEGKDYLTRNGRFKVSENGEIVAQDGKKLMGTNGVLTIPKELMENSEGKSDAKSVDVRIMDDGRVYANTLEIGSLAIAETADPKNLQRISNQDFIASHWANVRVKSQDQVKVKQGYLEGSNVDVIKEMVNMIELQRMFEAGNKVIQTNDGTLEKSITLGRY